MKYDIEFARKQVDYLDHFRIARALSGATEEFQHVFQLIPLLLHCNYLSLPGYVVDAPLGITDFKLSDYQRQYLHRQFPQTPTYQIVPNLDQTFLSIYGVYIMGSIASIAQTTSSDLDIWVCHRPDLSAAELQKLQQKLTALQLWAHQFDVEVNLFLMDEMRFRDLRYSKSMTQENSGSAQYMLLLDEFYRSAIRLAGKPLLWLHLLVEDESAYEQEVERLIQEKKLDPRDWVDFGGLGKFSAKEYFGASLWQLYKGIDAPYKATLKILLLEAYSYEYPNTRLIASDFKFHLLMDHTEDYHFDPYLEMLTRVTDYLTYHKDFKRLDFVRSCFYLKATEDLWYHQGGSWRFNLLNELTQKWGWGNNTLEELKQRPFWKIKQVQHSYNTLVKMLMLSYRNLINFARKYNIHANIMPQDLAMLTRKIYTAFEELPGKVNLINPQISTNLFEPNLTFVEVKKSNKYKKMGWYLLNQAPTIHGFSQIRYQEYNPNLTKLVAWAYFNELLTAETHVYTHSDNVQADVLNAFIADIDRTFPLHVQPPTNEELNHPCEIRQLLVAVNLTCDPTSELNPVNNIQQSDLFSFGADEKSLVGSIDLVYRNFWNEIRTLHFDGANAILLALKVLSNKIHRGSTSPEVVNVVCYSENYSRGLRNMVSTLVNKCINIQMGKDTSSKVHNLLRVAGKNWKFFFEERGISLEEVKQNSPSHCQNLGKNLEKNKREYSPHFKRKHKKTERVQYPIELDAFAAEGFLQFFFEDVAKGLFHVYILDEQNRIEVYRYCDGDKADKIREINQIYITAGADGKNPYGIVQCNFNYPQFYQLQKENNQVKILPFHRKF